MATENVTVNTNTSKSGLTYTSSISNDKLTNKDFLKIMLQELKLQDPTSPMDSSKMLETQMQMSTMETNIEMAKSMKALQTTIANMSLSNAMGFMNKKVDAVVDKPIMGSDGKPRRDEEGNTITEKVRASFFIKSVRIDDGKTYLESFELLGFKDKLKDNETGTLVDYDVKTGQIKDKDGKNTDYYIKLDNEGMFKTTQTGQIIITNKEGDVKYPNFTPQGQTDAVDKYSYDSTDEIYSKNQSNVEYDEIVKIY